MISDMELLLIIVAVTVVTGLAWFALDLVEILERRREARAHARPARAALPHREEVRS